MTLFLVSGLDIGTTCDSSLCPPQRMYPHNGFYSFTLPLSSYNCIPSVVGHPSTTDGATQKGLLANWSIPSVYFPNKTSPTSCVIYPSLIRQSVRPSVSLCVSLQMDGCLIVILKFTKQPPFIIREAKVGLSLPLYGIALSILKPGVKGKDIALVICSSFTF